MREYIKKPENKIRTLDTNHKSSKQAPMSVILQTYRNRTFGEQTARYESTENRDSKISVNKLVGNKVLQKITSIKHQPRDLTVGGVTRVVGNQVEADLDQTDVVKGSSSSNDTNQALLMQTIYAADRKNHQQPVSYGNTNSHYVKGHLLNSDLGGPGWALNMFPITSSANHAHKNNVELPAKTQLAAHHSIFYQVAVTNLSFAGGTLPQADLDCNITYPSPTINPGVPTQTEHCVISSIPAAPTPAPPNSFTYSGMAKDQTWNHVPYLHDDPNIPHTNRTDSLAHMQIDWQHYPLLAGSNTLPATFTD